MRKRMSPWWLLVVIPASVYLGVLWAFAAMQAAIHEELGL